jgi:hypothetical protein
MKEKIIRQGDLTADCWSIQIWGVSACKDCELKGTKDCGGKSIIKKVKAGEFPKGGLPDARAGRNPKI